MTVKSGDKKLFNPQEVPKIDVAEMGDVNRARWCAIEQLKHLGGFTLRTPTLDLTKEEHKTAVLEFVVSNRLPPDNAAVPIETTIATAILPVEGLMNCEQPFQQRILKLEGTEKGELYLMTRYAASKPEALRLDLATANEYLNHKVRVMQDIRSRFKCPPPPFQLMYNANLSQLGPAFNPAPRDVNSRNGPDKEEGQDLKLFADPFQPEFPPMAWEVEHFFKKAMITAFERDDQYAKPTATRYAELEAELKGKEEGLLNARHSNPKIGALCDKLFKAGLPDQSRIDAWSEITNAKKAGAGYTAQQFRELVRSVDTGKNTASINQLDEDFHALMSERRSPFPETQQVQESHLNRARDVCRALIAFSKTGGAGSGSGGAGLHVAAFQGSQGVAYCRALLYIAYHLCLLCKQGEEHKAFFLMFTVIGHTSNRTFEDYHALPKEEKMGGAQNGQAPPPGGALPAPPLCSPSASMADVAFLNTALAVYEPDLYARLSSCGFHCSMFFYKAFMRWYASVLPELTLFRFWDRLFYETTAKGPPLGKSNPNAKTPPQRSVLVELAFGVMTQSATEGGMGMRENLMACTSTAEIVDCLELGFLIYDVDLIGELVEYGKARLGSSAPPVDNTLMEATFSQSMEIYTNFSRLFKGQSQQISALLNDRKAGGAAGHLDTVTIHKYVVPRMRSWLGNPQNYKNIKEKVLKAMEYPGMGAGNLESNTGSDPVKNARFAGFFRPYPGDVLEINYNHGIAQSSVKLAKGAVFSLFGQKQGGQIKRPKLIDVTDDHLLDPTKPKKFGMDKPEPTLLDLEGFKVFMNNVFPDFSRSNMQVIDDIFHFYRGIPDTLKYDAALAQNLKAASAKTAAQQEKAFLSITELLASMIILSSGSVCEKALVLFHLYSGKGDGNPIPPGYYPHPRPPSVESTVKRMDEFKSDTQIGKLKVCRDANGEISAL